MSDDAYIMLRTLRNFVNGDGLRWNLAERVQSYSNPLWLFVLAPFHLLTGEYYLTVLFVSFAFSLAAVALVALRLHRAPTARVLAVTCLASSRSFVDYSTSGLENPLTHLLLALLLLVYLSEGRGRRHLFALSLIASLAAVNRLDTTVLTGPLVAAAWLRDRDRRALPAVALGWLPLVAWESFSLIYYGFPFPNTAYAVIPWWASTWDVAHHGLRYIWSSVRFDLVAATILAGGLILPLATGRRQLLPLSIGIALHLVYLLGVGGNFMAGRFFAAPFVFASTAVLYCLPAPRLQRWLVPFVLALGLTAGTKAPLLSGPRYGARPDTANIDAHGVADERGFYFRYTGLFRRGSTFDRPYHPWWARDHIPPGSVVLQWGGFAGMDAPRDAHLVDFLTDAFLARLPPIDAGKPRWRPGHNPRAIPDGYLATLRTGRNLVTDPDFARYLDKLDLAIRAPLWSWERFEAIWELNTGALDHLRRR